MSWPFQCAKQTQPSRKYHWRGNNGKWFSWLHYEPLWYLHMFVDNVGNSAACMPFQMTLWGLKHHISHLIRAADVILWLEAASLVENSQPCEWAGVGAGSLNYIFGAPVPPGVAGGQHPGLGPHIVTRPTWPSGSMSVHFFIPWPELGI